jgi:hypothetical protein
VLGCVCAPIGKCLVVFVRQVLGCVCPPIFGLKRVCFLRLRVLLALGALAALCHILFAHSMRKGFRSFHACTRTVRKWVSPCFPPLCRTSGALDNESRRPPHPYHSGQNGPPLSCLFVVCHGREPQLVAAVVGCLLFSWLGLGCLARDGLRYLCGQKAQYRCSLHPLYALVCVCVCARARGRACIVLVHAVTQAARACACSTLVRAPGKPRLRQEGCWADPSQLGPHLLRGACLHRFVSKAGMLRVISGSRSWERGPIAVVLFACWTCWTTDSRGAGVCMWRMKASVVEV